MDRTQSSYVPYGGRQRAQQAVSVTSKVGVTSVLRGRIELERSDHRRLVRADLEQVLCGGGEAASVWRKLGRLGRSIDQRATGPD